MAVATQQGIPADLEAGTTAIFCVGAAAEYPIGTWSATFCLSKDGQSKLNITASEAAATGYTFTITNAQSAALSAGLHVWAIYTTETSSGQRELWMEGTLNVSPYLGANQAQTPAQVTFAAIETALATLAAEPYSSVSFNGQSYTAKNHDELTKAWVFWKNRVLREQAVLTGQRGLTSSRSQVRFQ